MSSSFLQIDHLDISNQMDFPGTLLNTPASREKYLLIVGPSLVKQETTSYSRQRNTYLWCLLEGMLEWCMQKRLIQEHDVIHELRSLLQHDALVPLAYRIEEYLATRRLKEQCLRDVLAPYSKIVALHDWLTRIPFRGYITTGYDTSIETAYTQSRHRRLRKFYPSSFAQAIDASREEQPFILKLYGDLDNSDSIKLGHRLLTGLYAENTREQLRKLFSETPALFIGFSEMDEDLAVLENIVKEGCIVHQVNPTDIVEQVESAPEALPQKEMLLAVHAPPRAATTTRKQAIPRPSTPPDTQQDNEEETQQDYKIPISVCIYYAPDDKAYNKEIETLLNSLKTKEGKTYEIVYKSWAMDEPLRHKTDRSDPLLSTQLVILLFSRHFFGSKYYNIERMRNVVKRHREGALICCPILVGTYNWRGRQFDSLEEDILPLRDTSIEAWISQRKDEGEVYTIISDGLEYALEKLAGCLPENGPKHPGA